LNEEQEYLLKEAKIYNGKRAAIANLTHINEEFIKPWTNGIIPYVMDSKIVGECILHVYTSLNSLYVSSKFIYQLYYSLY